MHITIINNISLEEQHIINNYNKQVFKFIPFFILRPIHNLHIQYSQI